MRYFSYLFFLTALLVMACKTENKESNPKNPASAAGVATANSNSANARPAGANNPNFTPEMREKMIAQVQEQLAAKTGGKLVTNQTEKSRKDLKHKEGLAAMGLTKEQKKQVRNALKPLMDKYSSELNSDDRKTVIPYLLKRDLPGVKAALKDILSPEQISKLDELLANKEGK